MSEFRLTIGFSTLAERAGNIRWPAKRHDTEVVVVVQGGEGPVHPPGVRVVDSQSSGVAASRNEVIDTARGDYVIFADDDSTVDAAGVDQVLDHLDRHPDVALVLGRSVDDRGNPRKRHPTTPTKLHRWNSARAGTIEMIVRRQPIVDSGLRFDESFGAGTRNFVGDEYIFICDALRAGLRCVSLLVTVASHAAESSGTTYGAPGDARARAAVFSRVFGASAPIARLAFALRSPGRFGSPGDVARFVMGRFALESDPVERPHDRAADRPVHGDEG